MPRMNKLSNYATTISAEAGTTRIVYHSTTIVEFNESQIILRTGGWETVTTKRKMNQAARQFDLGYSVEQKDGDWFVRYYGKPEPFTGHTMTLDRKRFEASNFGSKL
jgi:hypothetical protein